MTHQEAGNRAGSSTWDRTDNGGMMQTAANLILSLLQTTDAAARTQYSCG